MESEGVSAVLETGDSFLVIHREPSKAVPPEELRRRAIAQLAEEKQHEVVIAYLDRLRANAIVRTLADPVSTASNVVTVKAGTIRFELESLPADAGEGINVSVQPLAPSGAARWSNGQQVICLGKSGAWCEWTFTATAEDDYLLNLYGTRTPESGQVQIAIDGKNLGLPVEFYAPQLQPTGTLPLGQVHLKVGTHRLRCTITGQHPSSMGSQFGLDALDLVPRNPESHR